MNQACWWIISTTKQHATWNGSCSYIEIGMMLCQLTFQCCEEVRNGLCHCRSCIWLIYVLWSCQCEAGTIHSAVRRGCIFVLTFILYNFISLFLPLFLTWSVPTLKKHSWEEWSPLVSKDFPPERRLRLYSREILDGNLSNLGRKKSINYRFMNLANHKHNKKTHIQNMT